MSNATPVRLTSVVAVDVAGYSEKTETDADAVARAVVALRTRLDDIARRHGGRIFNTAGDGVMLEFPAAREAMASIFAFIDERPDGEPEVRIGAHLGDVTVMENDDLLGHGVNVAARLMALAAPAHAVVSAELKSASGSAAARPMRAMGEVALAKMQTKITAFEIAPATLAHIQSSAAKAMSIAVLPFANMSGDPEQEYFADGISEDIITDLSKVSALSVTARNTAFTFKGKSVDIKQAARQLGVTHVLEGSVRKSGNRVRITAQLIDGNEGDHIWAERYDRDLDDIFALQDEISEAIVKALKLRLLPEEKRAIEARSTSNSEAYKYYLMARQYSVTGNARHREIIVRLCQRAVSLDPNYARAWALLAISLSNEVLLGGKTGEGGWDAAERALALDPNLAEAHAARGRILADGSHLEQARAEHEVALRLDPDSYDVNAAAARCFIQLRQFDDAARCLERAASAAPTDFWALGMAIQCYRSIGDRAREQDAAKRALDRVEKIIAGQPDHGSAMSFGVTALVSLGDRMRAKEWAERALLLDPTNTNLSYNLGCSMIQLGEIDAALEYLAPAITNGSQQALAWVEKDSDLDPIRNNPRFQALVAAAKARLAGT